MTFGVQCVHKCLELQIERLPVDWSSMVALGDFTF